MNTSKLVTNDGAECAKVRKTAPTRGGLRSTSGQGRKKGVPNKVTADARIAIAAFVNNNADRMQDWLDKVAVESPEKAFNMLKDVIEYHVPKLARTEITGKDGTALTLVLSKLDAKL